MEITKAKYIVSNVDVEACPKTEMPEFAFIGRSNVGKSSLINMLCKLPKLAKTSGTPGKTQHINHFLINEKWYLVDLPGYGYAKVSRKSRKKWFEMIQNYLTKRENLLNLFVLIDSRIEPQAKDLDFISNLGDWKIPFAIVFTKTDKSKQNEIAKNVNDFKKEILLHWEELPPMFLTSASKGSGRTHLLNFIEEVMNS